MIGHQLGKLMVLTGLAIAFLGILVYLGARVPWLGRLPGDLHIERPGFSFYFPLATSALISVVLSLIFYLIMRFLR